MNLNAVRKNYKELSLIERNALFISALQRGDQSEIDAIYAATPRKSFSEIDFYELKQNLMMLQMLVIIEKADYFSLAIMFAEHNEARHEGADALSLYLFFTLADAWKAICKDIGVDANEFEKMLFPDKCFMYRLAEDECSFRELAFTEDAARAFIQNHYKKECEIAFTYENKIAEFRKFLNLPAT